MLKKRLIFALLWRQGRYCLCRNFKLQNAGDLAWIEKNYNFRVIALAIDELLILNCNRGEKQTSDFARDVLQLSRGVFVPIGAGGGIRSVGDGAALLRSGADKLVVNSPIFDQPDLVRALVRQFGSQCVVASIDYRWQGAASTVLVENGTRDVGVTVEDAIRAAQSLGAGEILLTSVDRDGTGQGYDLATLERAVAAARVPVVASGGVGKFEHLEEWLRHPRARAASTANIFNFLGSGLLEARKHLVERGIPLATWDFTWRP